MIRSFTGWRYIFAVAIFMHHYQIDGKSVLQAGGVIGVTFFFILSGFLLAYGYKKWITFSFPRSQTYNKS